MRRASLLLIVLLGRVLHAHAADDIDMAQVRTLAEEPVKSILRDPPVHELARTSYWKTVRGAKTPVVVLFYSNVDGESQRLATLVRYVAARYAGRFATYGLMVVERGKPGKAIAADYEKEYSLDKTPGILFYDNDRGRQVLEGEQYIAANFKEFRTPSFLFWKTYYNAVCAYIDKNILD